MASDSEGTVAPTSLGSEKFNLYQKLAKITGEVGVIAKDGKNKEQGYGFIEYAAVAGRLRELFAKYGVVIIPRMGKSERTAVGSKNGKQGVWQRTQMSFNVVNADDPADKFTVTWVGEAMDFGDKATNKAATSALKYYLMRQFNISEKGEDPDAASPGEELKEVKNPPVSQLPGEKPAKQPPTDDQFDTISILAKQLKWNPDQTRKTSGMAKTYADADAIIDKMQTRLAELEAAE